MAECEICGATSADDHAMETHMLTHGVPEAPQEPAEATEEPEQAEEAPWGT